MKHFWSNPLAQMLVFMCLLVPPALAADGTGGSAQDLYVAGHYEDSIAVAQKSGGGDDLAAAAHSAIALAVLKDKPCSECLARAEGLARRAVAADPKNPDAQIYLAMTLGYEARLAGLFGARRARYPEQAKDAIDTAYALAPNRALVLAALGGWNIEVVRSGGDLLGGLIYDAHFNWGVEYFRRAIMADPSNLAIRYEFALALSGYGLDANHQEIEDNLKAATNGTPRTAYEAALRARAEALFKLYEDGQFNEYQALVRRDQGFPS